VFEDQTGTWLRQFLLRGVEKVRANGPDLTAHNLLKLFISQRPLRRLLCDKCPSRRLSGRL